jgi:hypothetical protein
MVTAGATTERPQVEVPLDLAGDPGDVVAGDAVEPIEVVLARLAPVEPERLTLLGCAAWLADAGRVAGWLAAQRARVDQRSDLLVWLARFGPPPDDPLDDEPAPGPTGPTGPAADAEDPEPEPEPSPKKRPGSARQKARDAKLRRCFALLPSFEGLLERGEITEDHVLALAAIRNVAPARRRERAIAAAARRRTAEGFVGWLRVWDAEVDLAQGRDSAARQHAQRTLRLFDHAEEMGEFRGALPPAVFDAFKRSLEAIDAELRRRPDADRSATYPQRMADALVELLHRANAGTGGSGSLRSAVVVLIELEHLLRGTGYGVTPDGTPIDAGEVRRMAAAAHVIPMVLGADSVPLDLGRAQRFATDEQWLALLARDRGCVLCDAPLGALDAHHAPAWHLGGRTDLAALCLLCRRCHRRVHAEGITITIDGGRVRATARDGRPLPTRPGRPARGAGGRASSSSDELRRPARPPDDG